MRNSSFVKIFIQIPLPNLTARKFPNGSFIIIEAMVKTTILNNVMSRYTKKDELTVDILTVEPEIYHRFSISPTQLAELCQRRHVSELALFGSILRNDFHSDSDIDILITFQPDVKISLLDLVDMQYELEDITDRKVDLLTKKSVIDSPNWIRRKEILSTTKVIYESRSSLST